MAVLTANASIPGTPQCIVTCLTTAIMLHFLKRVESSRPATVSVQQHMADSSLASRVFPGNSWTKLSPGLGTGVLCAAETRARAAAATGVCTPGQSGKVLRPSD